MVVVWKKQAETADKVTASLSTSDPDAPPMKLEDLEGHLNALKEMFIQKQKMMDDLEKTTGTIDNFSRIEFQVTHSNICTILAADHKLTLTPIYISYQNSERSKKLGLILKSKKS